MSGFPLILKPDEEEAEGAEIFVDGKIGGRAYRFLLDTGAAKTSVLPDEYTSTFSSSETHHSSGVFAQSSEDLITVPSIEVGPILKKNFTVVRSATNGTGKGSLIGMDLLKDFRCHFLFDQARVLIDEEDESGTDYPILALLLDQRFHPYVDVQFGTSLAKVSALGQKRTFAMQKGMSALLPIATAKADFRTRSCPL